MLILKSFFRKKTTKIYLIIFTSILTIMFNLILTKQKLINECIDFYDGSTITFESSKNALEKIKQIDNIKKITYGLPAKVNNSNVLAYLIKDEKLKSNEAYYLTNISEYELSIPSTIEINYNNTIHTYNISKKINSKTMVLAYIIYISEEEYNLLVNDSQNYIYILEYENHLKLNETIDNIENNINTEKIEIMNNKKIPNKIDNFESDITIYSIFSRISFIIFFITFIIILKNTLLDENNINYLYKYLGFTKRQTKIYNLLKIISLIFISIILALIIATILLLI